MRRFFVYGWLLLLLTGIASFFYYNEWKYSLPTPVPAGYMAVQTGTIINIPQLNNSGTGKPVFLHFFNPDCPCSRFNMEHVRSLVKEYGDKIDFKMVLVTAKPYTEKQVQDRFDIMIPVLHDSAIAALCGVYSTPQAVILDGEQRLFYRGNYNRSRYCTDIKTSYASIALNALLQKNHSPVADPFALTAYGCSLPGCNKQ